MCVCTLHVFMFYTVCTCMCLDAQCSIYIVCIYIPLHQYSMHVCTHVCIYTSPCACSTQCVHMCTYMLNVCVLCSITHICTFTLHVCSIHMCACTLYRIQCVVSICHTQIHIVCGGVYTLCTWYNVCTYVHAAYTPVYECVCLCVC